MLGGAQVGTPKNESLLSVCACLPAILVRMTRVQLADILELPVPKRLEAIELIWESIGTAVRELPPVSPELKAELENRLVELDADPSACTPWEEFRDSLRQRLWRAA